MDFWSRASEYANADDPQELRDAAAKALLTKGMALQELGRSEEALSAWRNVLEYIHRTDPTELRQLAVLALRAAGATLMELKRFDDSIAALRETSKYVRIDDAAEHRRKVADSLAVASRSLNLSERFSKSESVCKEATEIDPRCADAWHIWAEAILWRSDMPRLAEAETYARRATTLAPRRPSRFTYAFRCPGKPRQLDGSPGHARTRHACRWRLQARRAAWSDGLVY